MSEKLEEEEMERFIDESPFPEPLVPTRWEEELLDRIDALKRKVQTLSASLAMALDRVGQLEKDVGAAGSRYVRLETRVTSVEAVSVEAVVKAALVALRKRKGKLT